MIFKKKYLALDIGNVMVHTDMKPFEESLLELGVCQNQIEAHDFSEEIQPNLDIGISDLKTELKRKKHNLTEQKLHLLKQRWLHIITPAYQIIRYITSSCVVNGVKVAFLSNIGKDHVSFLKKDSGFLSIFTEKQNISHFSCDVGARKPSILFYQSFLINHPEFKGCCFVDDREENLIASEPFFKPIKFSLKDYSDEDTALDDLKKMLQPKYGF